MELQQPSQKPTTEIVESVDKTMEGFKQLLATAEPHIKSSDDNLNKIITEREEQEDTRKTLASLLQNYQALSTQFATLEQDEEVIKGILTVTKQKNGDLSDRIAKLETSQKEVIKMHNHFQDDVKTLHLNNTHLTQEVTFIKRIGLGIASLAFLCWLWFYTHKA